VEVNVCVVGPRKKIVQIISCRILFILVGMLSSYRGDIDPHINFMDIKFNQKSASPFCHGGLICKETGKGLDLSVFTVEG
jgi:hypothetical protein